MYAYIYIYIYIKRFVEKWPHIHNNRQYILYARFGNICFSMRTTGFSFTDNINDNDNPILLL